jgi:hypothetical protein
MPRDTRGETQEKVNQERREQYDSGETVMY